MRKFPTKPRPKQPRRTNRLNRAPLIPVNEIEQTLGPVLPLPPPRSGPLTGLDLLTTFVLGGLSRIMQRYSKEELDEFSRGLRSKPKPEADGK